MALRAGVYRDATDGKLAYLQQLRAEQELARSELPRTYAGIRARRAARAAAGAVLAAAGAAMFVTAIARFALHGDVFHHHVAGGLTGLLLAGWAGAAAAYLVARIAARVRFAGRLAAELAPTGDLDLDLERARRPPAQVAHGLATRPERASLVWPLLGLALVMPLSLHYVAAAFIGEPGIDHASFDRWIVMSALVVGHCHIVVAVRAYRFGRDLAASPESVDPSRAASKTWGMALAVSLFPGLILFAIPTLLVAVTGVFIPIAFAVVAARVSGERDQLLHAMRASSSALRA